MTPSRDDTIAAIYAAAAEPDGLNMIAAALRAHIDADSSAVWLTQDADIVEIMKTEDAASAVGPYLQHFRTVDPWIAQAKKPGVVYLNAELVEERKLVETEFYRDFARHYGLLRPMTLDLALDGKSRMATFILNRTTRGGLLGGDDRVKLQALAVHLQGALALRSRVLAANGESARRAALDAVSFGLVLTDEAGRVVDMNAEAEAMVREGVLSVTTPGRLLSATAPQEEQALRAMLARAAGGEAGAMRLRAPGGSELSLLAVPRRFQNGMAAPPGGAILYVQRAEAVPGPPEHAMMRLFGLSPAQAELCARLLAGDTFEEAAARRGVATSTARSHFGSILQRTGARNLRDLLRLLSSLPPLKE